MAGASLSAGQTALEQHISVASKIVPSGNGLAAFPAGNGDQILGLAPIEGNNLLFVSDNLANEIRVGSGWASGLRVAPEAPFYFKNAEPNAPDSWAPPSELHYSRWQQQNVEQPVDFACSCQCTLIKQLGNGGTLELENCRLSRSFQTISENPLRHFTGDLPFAGVTVQDTVAMQNNPEPYAAWPVVKVPSFVKTGPGAVIVPSQGNNAWVPYKAEFSQAAQRSGPDYHAVIIDGSEVAVWKCALRAESYRRPDSNVALLYVAPFPGGKTWFCLALTTSDKLADKQSDCIDAPHHQPAGEKGVIQVFNGFGGGKPLTSFGSEQPFFAELELQALPAQNGEPSSLTWQMIGFISSPHDIIDAASKLLQVREGRLNWLGESVA